MNYFRNLSVITSLIIMLSGCSGVKHHSNIKNKKCCDQDQSREVLGPVPSVEKDLEKALIKISRSSRNSYQLNPNISLEIAISDSGYTRFSMENERITDVFVYPQENVQVQIHQQGYLVIVPQEVAIQEVELEDSEEEAPKPVREKIYVTVTGEEGTTQDFSLLFTARPPEPVGFFK